MIRSSMILRFFTYIIIGLLLFQADVFLHGQEGDEITRQFIKARDAYANGRYISAKNRVERVIGIISDKEVERNKILGNCYLLLGAIYEKEGKSLLAAENYRKAKDIYGIDTIDELDMESLPIYKDIFKDKFSDKGKSSGNTIVKEGSKKNKKKKKFPWLLVAGGIVVVTIITVLLLTKKKKKYTLTVNADEGIECNPANGSYTHKKGTRINYSFTPKAGYSNVVVLLDGNEVATTGTITMKGDHTLRATASANEVEVVTDLEQDWLFIDENNTAAFNIKLSGQPRGDVTITVSRISGDTDIQIISGANLTFNTSNWNTFQTVTLKANGDSDIVAGEATIRISSSSPDIGDKYIFAKEVDRDTLTFVTSHSSLSITEAKTATFSVRLSKAPLEDVVVTISRISGDNDISITSGSSLIFNANNWFEPQQVVLEAAVDLDAVNGSALFRISAPDINSKDITVTETDKDSLNFVTDKDEVFTAEGEDAEFQVKLSAQPSGNINAVVGRIGGDKDITVVSGASLTFTPTDWDTFKTVTVHAAEDEDSINNGATMGISAQGMPTKEVVIREWDNDSLGFITSEDTVSVPEEGEASFTVRLSAQPTDNVEATVTHVAGDSDITVQSGGTLAFTTDNWDVPQTVILAAGRDDDIINGEAIIRISAPGLDEKDITAVERDNDGHYFETDLTEISVPENGMQSFNVRLSGEPGAEVSVTVAPVQGGDGDISVQSGSALTFTTANWETWQTVTLAAADDSDMENGTATIRISADGMPDKDITASEIDDDSLNFETDIESVSVNEGDTAQFQLKLSGPPTSNVTVNVETVTGGDEDITVQAGSSFIFTPTDWDTYQVVVLAAAPDDDTDNGTVTIRISDESGVIPSKEITATEVDDDVQAFETDLDEVSVTENGTAELKVRLIAVPSGDVTATVGVVVGGDENISVQSGSSLTFTPSDWQTWQTVTIAAADDEDAADGTATVRITDDAGEISDKDIAVTEVDDDTLAFVTDTENISVPEGSTAQFQVWLTAAPETETEVTVSIVSGDIDIRIQDGSTLTFNASNWGAPQLVTLEALSDADTENGSATVRISTVGAVIPTKEITATEADSG